MSVPQNRAELSMELHKCKEELQSAGELLRKVALMMRACDPEYCAAHNWGPTDDQHWDEVLNEVEDYVEDQAALGYAGASNDQG